nr:hypothetical protein MFLOJ_48360 [Mycobacterium florentinum]
MIGSSGSAEATPAVALSATAAAPTAAASLPNDSVIMLGHLPRIYEANDGYVICPSGCRPGRGYQPLRTFFSFAVIRTPRPECNYQQINVWVTFVTRRKSSDESRLAIVSTRSNRRCGDLRCCETDRMKPGNHRGVPGG